MKNMIASLAMMVGMFPKTDVKDKVMMMETIQAWIRGIVFGLSAVAAIYALITGGAWIYQVIVPRLLGA